MDINDIKDTASEIKETVGKKVGNVLCKAGLHKWKIIQEAKYIDEEAIRLGITCQDARRQCKRCGQIQQLERMCLGLNPPKYIDTWVIIKD